MVAKIGYTFTNENKFNNCLLRSVELNYNRIKKYDWLTHSCNSFSNEIIRFLTGGGVPDELSHHHSGL